LPRTKPTLLPRLSKLRHNNVNGSSRTFAWQYDQLYRLTNEIVSGTAPTGSLGYTYDDVGNRLSRTGSLGSLGAVSYTYSANDQISPGEIYDNNGSTTTTLDGYTFGYDYANRLTNSGSGATIIVYGADGNRIKKTVGAAVTIYLVATVNPTKYPQVVEELTVSGGSTNLSKAYVYGLDLISQRQASGTVSYYGYDGLGSTRFLTDSTGAVSDTYVYDAFGTQLASTGSGTSNNYRFTGEQSDADLNTYYLRARYYKNGTGRFLTIDPFPGRPTDPMSLHMYLYAGDNPVNNIDPSGHEFNLVSLQTSIATGLRITAQVGVRTGRVLTRARQFFWNNQRFQAVSRAYWRLNGPANGRSLHHWLIPQRWNFVPQGLRNAGFNLLEMPRLLPGNLGLNQWMGFAVRWGGYRAIFAYTIENGIKILIPLSIYQAATIGNHNDNGEPEEITLTPAHWEDDTGFEQLRTITDEMAEDLMDEPYPTNQPPP